MEDWRDAADVTSLAPGFCRTVEIGGKKLALVRVGDEFHAVDDACPHRGGAMGAGYVDGNTLYCPLHGWGFDVRTGAGLTRPDKPLRRYPTKVADGRVWVRVTEQGANS